MTDWSYTVGPPDDPPIGLGKKTATQFALMMRDLLPPGRLWRRDLGAFIIKCLLAAGDELNRVSCRSLDLLEESDPRTATELLPDYERELDLVASGTDAQRRNVITARIIQQLGVRPADYQEVLAPLLDLEIAQVQVIEYTAASPQVVAVPREIYRYFIYRDPLLPGTPDIDAAQAQVTAMEHSQTLGTVIESIDFLADDPNSLTNRDLLGA